MNANTHSWLVGGVETEMKESTVEVTEIHARAGYTAPECRLTRRRDEACRDINWAWMLQCNNSADFGRVTLDVLLMSFSSCFTSSVILNLKFSSSQNLRCGEDQYITRVTRGVQAGHMTTNSLNSRVPLPSVSHLRTTDTVRRSRDHAKAGE